MKRIRDLLHLDETQKLRLGGAAVGLLLLGAILIPLAFRTLPEEPEETESPQENGGAAAVFAEYWNMGQEDSGITVEKPTPSEKTVKFCEAQMRTLTDLCIDDRALDDPTPTGSEYTVLRSPDGTEVPLCRMWLEARGDWQNWLDVCFDAATGELYYLYLSRECLTNQKKYPLNSSVSAEEIADRLAQAYDWTLRFIGGDREKSAIAVLDRDGETVCFQIDCKNFDTLTDIKICCK